MSARCVPALLALPVLLALQAGTAHAADFELDLAHTSVTFGASHFGRSTVLGRLRVVQGTVTFDETTQQGSVDVTLDPDSVDTGNGVLDKVLRGEQFFDAARFPTLRFQGDRFVHDGARLAAVEGTLTAHGKTVPLRLEAQRFSCGEQRLLIARRHVCGGDFTATVSRAALGMDALSSMVGDEVHLLVSVEASPK